MQGLIVNFESLSEEELTKYAGEWIAIADGKIIAHDKNFKKVYLESKEKSIKGKPLIGRVPDRAPVVLSIY